VVVVDEAAAVGTIEGASMMTVLVLVDVRPALSVATVVDSGTETVSSGGTASNTVLSSGGSLAVSSGGLADPTTIYSGGSEIISRGGTDLGAHIPGAIAYRCVDCWKCRRGCLPGTSLKPGALPSTTAPGRRVLRGADHFCVLGPVDKGVAVVKAISRR
jgi:autotransporter passenger strand-loop-strand repeat protein